MDSFETGKYISNRGVTKGSGLHFCTYQSLHQGYHLSKSEDPEKALDREFKRLNLN